MLLLIIALVSLLLVLCMTYQVETFANHHSHAHPCRSVLTDEEYLEHMIPHHQVAIDVSKIHKTNNVLLANVLRKLIWTQEYEITLMKEAMRKTMQNVSGIKHNSQCLSQTTFSNLPPNQLALSKTVCDPHFFDPELHMSHMSHAYTDKEYIEHMIPHHQVAVDMSKRLLEHTKSDFMIYLAYRIIRSQEAEIKLLDDLKQV